MSPDESEVSEMKPGVLAEPPVLKTLTLAFGSLTAFIGALGIVGLYVGIPVFISVIPGSKAIAFSSSVCWLLLGVLLLVPIIRPVRIWQKTIITVFLGFIILIGAIELPLNLAGAHFLVESYFIGITRSYFSETSTPISPVAIVLLIISAAALLLLFQRVHTRSESHASENLQGVLGVVIVLVSFPLIMGYLYGTPFLYGSSVIPIAFTAALAAFFMGCGLITSTPSIAFPHRFFTGRSIRSRLLRYFLPLTIALVITQNFLDWFLALHLAISHALIISVSLVFFCLITAYAVFQAAETLSTRVAHEEQLRRELEAALQASERRYRALYENALVGLFETCLSDATVISCNQRYADLAGFDSPEEAQGKDILQLYVNPADRDTIARILREEGTVENYEIQLRNRKTGIHFWSQFSARINRARDSAEGTIIDITEKRDAEERLKVLIQSLEQKNAELERFTYTVSHDLKSPLITIRGFLGLLEEDALKGDIPRLRNDIVRISSASDKMQTLLSDLLALSRIGRISSPPELIAFGTIAQEAAELLEGSLRKRNVGIEIAPDLPEVYVDHTRIREVLVNLIENALKFMGDQPEPMIRIGRTQNSEEPVFFVEDNGIGIEPQYREKIFGLFEKLDARTEGSGVGLAIVKRIIEVHGGSIWIESEGAGKGTTVFFTLPVIGSKCIYHPKDGINT